jgi:hypothetical protein
MIKKLNPKNISYKYEIENGANTIIFVLNEKSVKDLTESDLLYSNQPRIKFELKSNPLDVVKEYDKIIAFLKLNQTKYPYVSISIEDATDQYDNISLQSIHNSLLEVDNILLKYAFKKYGKFFIYADSLIQKDEEVSFQITYLETRKELFNAMYKDSLNPNNYENSNDLTFGFVWYAN